MHNFYSYPPPNIQPAHHFGGLFFGIYTFSINTYYCTIFFTYFLGNNRVYCSLHKTSLFYSNLYFLRRISFLKICRKPSPVPDTALGPTLARFPQKRSVRVLTPGPTDQND